jgi:hypothetical protein
LKTFHCRLPWGTFAAFWLQTLDLMRGGATARAFANVALSVRRRWR